VSCVEVNEELLAESDFDMDENICDNSDSKWEVIRDNSIKWEYFSK
jgi:hypothetical protein